MKQLLSLFISLMVSFSAYANEANPEQGLDISPLLEKNAKAHDLVDNIKQKKALLNKIILAKSCLKIEKEKITKLQEKLKFWLSLKKQSLIDAEMPSYKKAFHNHLKRFSICETYLLTHEPFYKKTSDFYYAFKKSPLISLKQHLITKSEKGTENKSSQRNQKTIFIIAMVITAITIIYSAISLFRKIIKKHLLPASQRTLSRTIVLISSCILMFCYSIGIVKLYWMGWDTKYAFVFYKTFFDIFIFMACILFSLNLINYSKLSVGFYSRNESTVYLIFLVVLVAIVHLCVREVSLAFIMQEGLPINKILSFFEISFYLQSLICFAVWLLLIYKHPLLKKLPFKNGISLIYLAFLLSIGSILQQPSSSSITYIFNFIFSLPVSFVIIFSLYAVFKGINHLPESNFSSAKKICQLTLLDKNSRFHEIYGLNYLVFSLITFSIILNMFGIDPKVAISNEINILELHFSLSQIYTMAFIFIGVRLFFKVGGNLLFPRDKKLICPKGEISNYQSGYILSLYAGSFIAVLLALLAGNISLTGILVVIGALSVGIGIGLKNIVNNLISGIILIFENSIRVGDFIQVGKYEGLVIKTGIRAMQIKSLDNIDILIPNETLIAESVEHFSLETRDVRLKIYVGVAFDSDLKKVSEILFSILESHPDILMKDINGKPCTSVIFSKVSDFELKIMLGVRIKDIRIRERIKNYVNEEVLKQFAQNGIEKPYPKTDIYLKKD